MLWKQRVSQDFCLGGPPGTFSIISLGAGRIQWGWGVVAEIFPVDKSTTFPRFREVFGALTEIQAHFPALLTHSNHVTTSNHSRKKHLPKVWGAMAPLAPPGHATEWKEKKKVLMAGKRVLNILKVPTGHTISPASTIKTPGRKSIQPNRHW